MCEGRNNGVVANKFAGYIIVNEFEHQPCFYAHFALMPFRKIWTLLSSSDGFNNTSYSSTSMGLE